MSFPNVSDIVATTIENRSKQLADNVTDNNAGLAYIKKSGGVKTFSGGTKIYQELLFNENSNFAWYSGYESLPTNPSDVVSAAEFNIKQAAVAVVISGLEQLQNAGKEQMIDLLEGRVAAAEATMVNNMALGFYSDGTGSGGKIIDGLDAAVPVTPSSGTYGGISRSAWTFWQSQVKTAGSAISASTVQGEMNAMYAKLVRGTDRPTVCIMDNVWWTTYLASLQAIQRITDSSSANLGFPTVKFMGVDVVLDGGMGGNATTKTAYWLNTKYLFWRPHAQRDMVPLSPNKRYSTNQDAEVQLIAWAGNMTSSGSQFQGRSITP
jgi:hypothetical protein